jgi:hypothetical protein
VYTSGKFTPALGTKALSERLFSQEAPLPNKSKPHGEVLIFSKNTIAAILVSALVGVRSGDQAIYMDVALQLGDTSKEKLLSLELRACRPITWLYP